MFRYRWLAGDAAISGATGSTYTLADGDVGKTITVRVSFTDDAGNAESVTSTSTLCPWMMPALSRCLNSNLGILAHFKVGDDKRTESLASSA